MKKINILLFLLLSIAINAQTVSMQVVVGNSGNTINIPINTSSYDVIIATSVSMTTSPSDMYPGTIKIYYQKNATSPAIVANGGDGGSLLFQGATTAVRQILITLNSAQFNADGGFVYAEYQTYSGSKYKSSNFPVKIVPTPTDPGNGGSTSCALYERVPYNGIPILPYHDPQYQEWYILPENLPYSTFNGPGQPVYSASKINQRDIGGTYPTSCEFNIYVRPIFTNITSRFFIDNTIASNQYVNQGTSPQTITGNSAILTYTTGGRGDQVNHVIPLNNYQWQKRIVQSYEIPWAAYTNYMINYGWQNIPGATGQNYTPPATTGVVEYRRLIIENPEAPYYNWNTAASNVISIYTIGNTNVGNTICCNQTITNINNIPTINGNSPISLNGTIYYQWQSSADQQNWSNIYMANSYSYKPASSGRGSGGRRNDTSYMRRILIHMNTGISYISNTVAYTYQIGAAKINADAINLELKNLDLTIYPNPSQSVLNIDNNNMLLPLTIKFFDLTGRQVADYELTNSNSFQINISTLPKGTYIVTAENNSQKTIKRIIKE